MANLGGRLVLGILSDKMSRIRVITIAQLITLGGMGLLLFVPLNANLFFVAVACVAFSFGGTITVYPSLVSDFFASYDFSEKFSLYGGINNALDREPYLGSLVRPAGVRGRFFYLGLRGKF